MEPSRIEEYLNTLPSKDLIELVNKPTIGKYYNIPISFDIETSSFLYNNEKTAIMYCWQFKFGNTPVIIGRTWEEFAILLVELKKKYEVTIHKRMVIYIHNEAFEFQFLRKLIPWKTIKALDNRKVYNAVSELGFEFRCSYVLTNKSLSLLGKEIGMNKLVGDLDYSKIRHSKTKLTKEEIKYCERDVEIINKYIYKQLEKENIAQLPNTCTGFVRREVKKICSKNKSYFNRISSLTLEVDEYKLLKKAFMGGFTHANHNHVNKVLSSVRSYDLTSAYPAVMLSERFPMSKGQKVMINTIDEFNQYLKSYCCLFSIHVENVLPKFDNEHFLSVSKCKGSGIEEDNGRIVSAKYIETTLTEVDFQILNECYTYDNLAIKNMWVYRKGYLPKEILESVLYFYAQKTTLKGQTDSEELYLLYKGMLNSIYGMMVTDIARNEYTLDENSDWVENVADINEVINKYNNAKKRFIHYPWGVWITAYNRRNLWSAILAMGEYHVYCDTDSEKFIEHDTDFFNKYNDNITRKLHKVCEYYNFNWDDFEPEDIKHKKHLIGVFDNEGIYIKFKTLGAKRYLTMKQVKNKKNKIKKEISMTVSGLNKDKCLPYLLKKYGSNIFESFDDELYIPAGYTGKNVHSYIDEERHGWVTDYLGETCEFNELSGIYLNESDYSLSLSEKFKLYIMGNKMIK